MKRLLFAGLSVAVINLIIIIYFCYINPDSDAAGKGLANVYGIISLIALVITAGCFILSCLYHYKYISYFLFAVLLIPFLAIIYGIILKIKNPY